jgi:hypothetical protein
MREWAWCAEGLTSSSTVRRFSETSRAEGSSSFFMRIAVFVRARWSASSWRRRARTSRFARRAERGWRISIRLGLVEVGTSKHTTTPPARIISEKKHTRYRQLLERQSKCDEPTRFVPSRLLRPAPSPRSPPQANPHSVPRASLPPPASLPSSDRPIRPPSTPSPSAPTPHPPSSNKTRTAPPPYHSRPSSRDSSPNLPPSPSLPAQASSHRMAPPLSHPI